jgi:hypothetical protein
VRARRFCGVPGLDPDLKVGLFGESRSYPAWVRFSNQNNGVSPDSKPDIRGVAIKLMGVSRTELIDSDSGCTTHDFILISENRLVTKDVAEFDGLVKGMMGGRVRLACYFLTHPRCCRIADFVEEVCESAGYQVFQRGSLPVGGEGGQVFPDAADG